MVDRLVLKSPVIAEFEVFGPSERGDPVELRASIVAPETSVLGAQPLAAITPPRPPIFASRMEFEGISLTPLRFAGIGWTQETDRHTASALGNRKCTDFLVVAAHGDITALYAWYSAGVLNYQPPAALLTRNADLKLVDERGGLFPLASISGLVMTAFEAFNDVDGTLKARARFVCDAIALAPGAFR